MAGLGIGAGGQAGIVKESAYGSAGTVDTFLELVSEDVKLVQEKIPAGHMMESRNVYKYYNGSKSVEGSFTIEVNPDNIGLLAYCTLGVEASASSAASGVYDHDFTPAGLSTDLGSFTLEINRGLGNSNTFIYDGCVVDSMTLEAAKGSLLKATFDILGQDETDDQNPQALTASTKTPFTFDMGQVKMANAGSSAAAIAYCNSISITYSNNLDADGGFILDGNAYRAHCYKQEGTLTGTMELEYTSTSDEVRDWYRDNTEKTLELVFTSTETVVSGYYYTLTLDIPQLVIKEASPVISGRDRVPLTAEFEAIYDSTNFCKLTLRDASSSKYSA